MSTIFHQGRKLLRLSLNGNHNLAEIADLLHFRISGSSYKDKNGQFFLLPNIEHLTEHTGFGVSTCKKSLDTLEKKGFIQRVKTKCFDGAVRVKIFLTKKFKSIMLEISNLKNNGELETLKNVKSNTATNTSKPVNATDSVNTTNTQAFNENDATETATPAITSQVTNEEKTTIQVETAPETAHFSNSNAISNTHGNSSNNSQNNQITPNEASVYDDSLNVDLSDRLHSDESYIKEQTKNNNIVGNVVLQVVGPKKEKSLGIIDSTNTPEFTQDKVILDIPTPDQIDAIETITKTYEVDGGLLFETVMELCNTKADYFEDFNQILAVAINQQLEPLAQAKALETKRAKCKYEIDFRATEMANDERSTTLDDTQTYAVDHNLKYLQKRVGKRFDFDELKGWVTHSLLHGYKGLGFQKAIRCIVKAIKEDKYTRPYSLKAHYLEAKA
jgi:DNA-binding MarR family transcriptional regulator